MMETKFYRVVADATATSRWYLKGPVSSEGVEIDPRNFRLGKRVAEQPPLVLPLRREGTEVDFNFCDFDMVVTPREINEALEPLLGSVIQRIPVTITGTAREFEILNVCDLVACIDATRSEFLTWTAADGRPEKIGQFRTFRKLRINASEAYGHHMFRLAHWPIVLVISEEVQKLFAAKNVSGVTFELIS